MVELENVLNFKFLVVFPYTSIRPASMEEKKKHIKKMFRTLKKK